MAPTPGTHGHAASGGLASDMSAGQPGLEAVGRPSGAWLLFAGVLVGSALAKELFRGVWRHPAFLRARHLSRSEEAFSATVLMGLLQQIGARVVGYTRSG
jgi:hypothetical protein